MQIKPNDIMQLTIDNFAGVQVETTVVESTDKKAELTHEPQLPIVQKSLMETLPKPPNL